MNINTYPSATDLRYFQELASTGNVSRAAERLGVGQPTLSLSLKRLEEDLGAVLFLRRHRGLELTPAGHKLLRETHTLLQNWERIVSDTKKTAHDLVGRFRLGCHPSVAIYALKSFLKSFYESYPTMEIELVHGLSRQMTEAVISGQIDFALVVNPLRHPDLVLHKLATDKVTFWKTTKGLEDVLIYNPALAQAQSLIKKLGTKKQFSRSLISDNLEVIAQLSAEGAGVAILPTRVAESHPNLSPLRDHPSFSDEIYFTHRTDLHKTAATKTLITQLKTLKF